MHHNMLAENGGGGRWRQGGGSFGGAKELAFAAGYCAGAPRSVKSDLYWIRLSLSSTTYRIDIPELWRTC